MPLLKTEFTCEVLTPMFLSGVDQKTCELRAASLRGVLRYWYRALLGGQGVTDLGDLKKCEAAVFGSTEAASPVSIRVVPVDNLAQKTKPPSALPNWDTKRNQLRQNTGIGYLWFSIGLGENQRHYIEPGTKFKVIFSAIASGEQEQQRRKAMRDALRAFWLLAHLGGLGTRARRGAGSFWIRGMRTEEKPERPKFTSAFDDTTLSETLNDWMVLGGAPPSFPALMPGQARIVRQELGARTWEQAIEKVGWGFKEFRFEHKGDSDPDRASFGLPLTLGRGGSERTLTLDHAKETLQSDRRGSPLWIRIVPITGGTYDAIYTYLGGPFATDEHRLKISRSRGSDSFAAPAVPGLIPAFLDTLQQRTTLFS